MDTSYIKNNYKNPKEMREKNRWFDGDKYWRRSNIKWQKQKKKKKTGEGKKIKKNQNRWEVKTREERQIVRE